MRSNGPGTKWLIVIGTLFLSATLRSQSSTTITRAEYGDAWPFTVPTVTLRCDRSRAPRLAVILTAGDRRYGLNGSAKDIGLPGAESITKDIPPDTKFLKPVIRLTELQRRGIFQSMAACENNEATEARCKSALATKHKVKAAELARISDEGVAYSWPPLSSPMKMNIAPFIQRGLALCR